MKKRVYTVYRITCLITRLSYIGATVKPVKDRWKEHARRATTFAKNNPMYADVRKYGEANFVVLTIHKTYDFDTAMTLERAAIAEYDTVWPRGYNLQTGGRVGAKHHEISRKRVADSHKGESNPFYGKTHGAKTIERIKETRKTSQAWKQAMDKLHESNIGKSWGNHTEEAKAKMSLAKKGRPQSPEHIEKRMAGMRAAREARKALEKAAVTEE